MGSLTPRRRAVVTLSAPVSILVVVERPRRPRTASRTTAVRSCFNPCCGGTTSPTRPAPAPRGGERGFNPCCGGTPSPTADPRHAPGPADRVSILVVVERPRRPQASYEAAKVGEVSILVVVERPRRRRETDGGHPVAGRVSILVVVERPRRRDGLITSAWPREGFQSLLWWNDLADRSPAPMAITGSLGFNPCCGGTTSPTRWGPVRRGGTNDVSILVVVERPRRQEGS